MECQRMCSRDRVLNFVFVQQREQIPEVGQYFHGDDGVGSQQQQFVPPVCDLANSSDRQQLRSRDVLPF